MYVRIGSFDNPFCYDWSEKSRNFLGFCEALNRFDVFLQENKRRAEEEKARRLAKEQREKEINEKRHAEVCFTCVCATVSFGTVSLGIASLDTLSLTSK